MITKYKEYIKEGMHDESYANFIINVTINLYLTSGTGRYNHIKIYTNRDSDKDEINKYFKYELFKTTKVYDTNANYTKNYNIFQLENQLEYNYFIFYYTYVKEYILSPIMYDPFTFESTKRLSINMITTNNFILEINHLLEVIKSNRFEGIIDKYLETTGNLTSFVISLLTDRQKIKFDYLINAKNFDII